MAQPSWKTLEEEVRGLARTIWGSPFESRNLFGRQIDAYAQPDAFRAVAIEVTEEKNINKLQEDVNKLTHVRHNNFAQHILTECILVTTYIPTDAMRNVYSSVNIALYTIDEFRHKFLPFDLYYGRRVSRPFGSAMNPTTGERDGRAYVVVQFESDDLPDARIDVLEEQISSGRAIIVTGEYGTGKSKCLERLFELLSGKAWSDYRFPVSIDLRRSWGLRDRYEILRRHLEDLNLSEYADQFIKAYNDGFILLLIDGFDELGTQAWSDNPSTMKALRWEVLSGTRDLISKQTSGVIVCGREHYFNSSDEMVGSLGLANRPPLLVRSHDEFSYEEISEFLTNAGYDYDVPEWLPRKPLTCEFFVKLFSDMEIELNEEVLDPNQFWDLFLEAVCDREAHIHSSFDPETIKNILVSVAALTRVKPANVGPLTLTEVQDAFEDAVGYAPIEQAGVLLQRLPGLGRTSADTEDRRFVDTYLLEGLKALHVIRIIGGGDRSVLERDWLNPLTEEGLLISSRKISTLGMAEEAVLFAKTNNRCRNKTMLFDIVCSVLLGSNEDLDFGAVEIRGGHATFLDLSRIRVKGLHVEGSIVERLTLPGSSLDGVRITDTNIGRLEGVSNESGIPDWLQGNNVESFTSIATVSRIKHANISPNNKVLVTILRKTYFQKGAARKEEALLRGLGRLTRSSDVERILNRLISEGLLTHARGDTGTLYAPVRAQTRRVGKMLAELNMSRDEVWEYVDQL